MSANQAILAARARVAGLSRSRDDDDPELVTARSTLKAEMLAERIRVLSENPPPLTDRQREVIMSAFAGFTPSGGDVSGSPIRN